MKNGMCMYGYWLQQTGFAAKPAAIEVFKTNVQDPAHAQLLLGEIHRQLAGCEASFDLEDCDRILRVKSGSGPVDPALLQQLLRNHGYSAEVLPD